MHFVTTLDNASTAALKSKHMIRQVIGVMHHLTGMISPAEMMDQGIGMTEYKTGTVDGVMSMDGQVMCNMGQMIGMIASMAVCIKMHVVTGIQAPSICIVSK